MTNDWFWPNRAYDTISLVIKKPACFSSRDSCARAYSATTPSSNGRPSAMDADRPAMLIFFARGETSRRTVRACGATSPFGHRTLTRLTGDLGRPSTVGEYVPELSEPQAAHLSENRPPCRERAIRDDAQAGQIAGLVIVDAVASEPT